jgi:hypothetical protein
MASVITSKGRDVLSGRMVGATPTQAEPKVMNWGVPSAQFTAAVSDIALFAETAEARQTGTSSVVTTSTANDTYQVVATLTASGTRAVTEVALLDSTTKPFSTTVASGAIIGSSSATTFTSGASFTPANNTYIQIRTEVLQVTAGSGSTSLTVTRGQNGSAAIATIAASDVVTAGNIPGASAITGGTLLAHFDFAVINLSSGNTLQSTAQVQFQ